MSGRCTTITTKMFRHELTLNIVGVHPNASFFMVEHGKLSLQYNMMLTASFTLISFHNYQLAHKCTTMTSMRIKSRLQCSYHSHTCNHSFFAMIQCNLHSIKMFEINDSVSVSNINLKDY